MSKLRFTVRREIWVGTQYQWIVEGNLPDWADDFMWGNFDTWRDALDAVTFWLRNEEEA